MTAKLDECIIKEKLDTVFFCLYPPQTYEYPYPKRIEVKCKKNSHIYFTFKKDLQKIKQMLSFEIFCK